MSKDSKSSTHEQQTLESSQRRLVLKTSAGVLLLPMTGWTGALHAQQAYPVKPVHFVIPFAPGGSADIVARLVSAKLSESLGKAVVVESRPGAGGTIAADSVAKAAPDGYTLLVADFGPNVVAGSLYPKLPYDPAKDFSHVILMVTFPFVLMVPASSSIRSLPELITQAKAKPGALRYSSAGIGASSHLLAEMMNRMAGIEAQHVPYKGGAPALQALLTGEVDFTIQSVSVAQAMVGAGKVRALGVTSLTPVASLPDAPPLATLLRGYEGLNFHGLLAPAQTPAPIIAKLNQEVTKVLQLPDLRKRFDELSMTVYAGTPEAFAAFLNKQMSTWTALVRSANIRAE